MYRTVLSAIAGLALVACARGDDTETFTDTATGAVTSTLPADSAASDANVMATLVALHTSEIRASEFAADSVANTQVKEFARAVVADHRALNETLHSTATQLNIVSHTGSSTEDVAETSQDIVGQLQGKRGAELDRAYLDAMVRAHESALTQLDQAANATNTPRLDQLIVETRTKVQEHLNRARTLQQQRS